MDLAELEQKFHMLKEDSLANQCILRAFMKRLKAAGKDQELLELYAEASNTVTNLTDSTAVAPVQGCVNNVFDGLIPDQKMIK